MFISFIKIQILIQITQNHVVSFTFLTPLPILLQERPSCIISHPRAQSPPLLYSDTMLLGFPRDSVVKTPPANEEPPVQSLSREDPWRRKWQPIPVYLPGKSHRQRNLVGCDSWGSKVSDMTGRLNNNNMLNLGEFQLSGLIISYQALVSQSQPIACYHLLELHSSGSPPEYFYLAYYIF